MSKRFMPGKMGKNQQPAESNEVGNHIFAGHVHMVSYIFLGRR